MRSSAWNSRSETGRKGHQALHYFWEYIDWSFNACHEAAFLVRNVQNPEARSRKVALPIRERANLGLQMILKEGWRAA